VRIGTVPVIAALFLVISPLVYAETDYSQPNLPPHYSITDLGTLGGTFSIAFGVSNKRWITGSSTLPGDIITHPFLWRGGGLEDIGRPGLNSAAFLPFNERGQVAIQGEEPSADPLGEASRSQKVNRPMGLDTSPEVPV